MGTILHTHLDMWIETLGLLYFSHQPTLYREKAVELFNETGIDGEAFYAKHAKMYEKYVRIFSKYKRVDSDSTWLLEENIDILSILSLPFLIRREDNFVISDLDEERLRKLLIRGYAEVSQIEGDIKEICTIEEFIELIETAEFSSQAKWKLMMIYRNPCPYFRQMDKLINDNLDATQRAVDAVRPTLDKLISRFSQNPERFPDRYIIKNMEGITNIYPLFVMPFSQLLVGSTGFYGLLWDTLMEHTTRLNTSAQMFCSRFKALGDKSKLDILLLLRQGKSYNQEIAAKLGLTPATVSYHMDTLNSCGLIDIERQDRRIYYSLRVEKIWDLINELKNRFYLS